MKPTCQDITDTGCQALRLHRPLIEINEFAKREGITIAEIEKCSEIGILLLRKNKGKTYVVDMPVSSYENTPDIDNEVAELIRIKKPAPKLHTQHKTISHQKTSPIKNFTGKLQNCIQKTTQAIKDDIKPQTPKPQPENKTKIQNEDDDLPTPPKKKSNIKPGQIKKLIDNMLRRAESIRAHTKKPAQTDSNRQNQTPAPEKTNPYIEHVVKTMHAQLDDIEKRIK